MMKACGILLCLLCFSLGTDAQTRTYLVTAPLSLHVDAVETVLLQLFGFTEEVQVYVFLKTSMAPDHRLLAQDAVTLNAQNHHQAAARVRLLPGQLGPNVDHVILHVQSTDINQHVSVAVTRANGFLFVQTDKPLYTPLQSVKVRAFSLNQELRPANRSVLLTFRDPDHTTVDVVEMMDLNNGIPSMQNPFKIPIKPKLGVWSIEAAYTDHFTTKATADFEVREYVLPSFSINVEPEENFISYGSFSNFRFKVSARYLHGAPVADGEVYLRYGYVTSREAPVIIPNSVSRRRLSSDGELEVTLNMEKLLAAHSPDKDFQSLVGSFLYITVLLQEDTGGITQEVEFASVKFVRSPYRLSLVSTPPFIKPGLPYNIQVLVKDHLDQPVSRVPVRLVERQLFRRAREVEDMPCPDQAVTQSDGLAIFICNTPREAERAVLRFETADAVLPSGSQANLRLEALAYRSANQWFLYIDPPLPGQGLQVGRHASVKVYLATPAYVPIRAISYVVLSKGKVVDFGSQKFVSTADNKQMLRFRVTGAMVPSVRLLVYYIVHGEGTSELVADSVWLDVKDACVNDLETELSYPQREYKPKSQLRLGIRTNQAGLVALSAVDTGLLSLRPNHRDPVSMVLRHIEKSDQGCGGGGGKDGADVFRLAGLTFITNANAQPTTEGAACTAAVRPKRALTEEEREAKASSYGPLKTCCLQGMLYSPKSVTCEKFAEQAYKGKKPRCQRVFAACCLYIQENQAHDQNVLGRNELGADFDQAPSLVRSYFPESWLWEVHDVSRQQEVSRTLPDSLTTWEIKAVGMFQTGICVASAARVAVRLPLSLDVALPYQLVRGEQLELRGSVYNQQPDAITYCVTLRASEDVCVLGSQPDAAGAGLRSTACEWAELEAGGVGRLSFTVMPLRHGEHPLTFTVRTRYGPRDVLVKKLRVVPEGVRQEVFSGGTLDPRGLYGAEKRTVVLRNRVPPNLVPNTAVERMLTISGEVAGETVSVVMDPSGLRQLLEVPGGSAEGGLAELQPLTQLYLYLEATRSWGMLGSEVQKSSADLRRRMKEGMVSVSSFRLGDSSYSMWMKKEASTWVTAAVVRALAAVDGVFPVDHQALSDSLSWLIRSAQDPDGSFKDTSTFRPNKMMVEGAGQLERSVYLTSWVLMALRKATSIRDPILQLRFHDDSMAAAANYISQHAPRVQGVYALAVATYALALHDPHSGAVSTLINRLERLARQKAHPATLRYWQEASVTADWLKPDETSGLTVETTAYVLLTMLLKGRLEYANSIVSWLIQDQHYGEGFYSVQDTVLTLEALTEYSKAVPSAVLDQHINLRYMGRGGALGQVQLSQRRPVASPIQVKKDDDITVTTGFGSGVSSVKMKTVYYQTTPPQQNCNFDLNIELVTAGATDSFGLGGPHLVACVKFRSGPNQLFSESSLTVMKIALPSGVEAFLDDLRQFRDVDEPLIAHYELQGNTVMIQADTVPSEHFLCVGFRVRTRFTVGGAGASLFSVYEPQDKGSMCTKQFSFEEQRLQRLCVAEQCQCMTAACATYRGDMDASLTVARRLQETCQPHITYAFKVRVTEAAALAEGDFVTFAADVEEVLKNTEPALETLSSGSRVELIKKVTCTSVNILNQKHFLVMGSGGSEVKLAQGSRFRLPLDSGALLELWPDACDSPECMDYVGQLEDLALELQLASCPDSD